MQRFMRARVAAPLAGGDLAAVASALEQLATRSPAPKRFRQWGELCAQGAAAARSGRPRGVLLSCVKCHDTLRREYIQAYRERAVGE
jgi:hypothetical protein